MVFLLFVGSASIPIFRRDGSASPPLVSCVVLPSIAIFEIVSS